MGETEKARLSSCLADYHRRVSLGEKIEPEAYRDDLGRLYPQFQKVLAEGAVIDVMRSPPDPQSLPRSFGQFTLLRELGRGASGVVYEALQRHLGRRVALKILRTGFDTHASARERFRREARACAQVEHDHIVEIYEAGVEDDRPYYAMTLLEGKSLIDVIEDGEAPDPRTLCAELANIADALQCLHDRGIIHRDVKPSNIMVEPGGRFILADFGLARTADAASLTQTGDALGTPLYMSPEQMLGKRKEIDGRTDVYGLGATLYEAATGETPFKTRDLHDLLRMVLTERPIAPRKIDPTISKELERIILKCVEKRSEDRYQTAGAVRSDLLALASGGEVQGKPISRARHEARRMVSTPRRIAVAAVVLALVGAVAWLAMRTSTKIHVLADGVETAMVSINDGPAVSHDQAIEVEPGRAHVLLTADGYLAYQDDFDAVEGETTRMRVTLVRSDWLTNREGRANVLGGFQANGTPIEEAPRERGMASESDVPILVFPRGRVRPADLVHAKLGKPGFEIQVPISFEGNAIVIFSIDGKEVGRSDFPSPEQEQTTIELPQSVIEALASDSVASDGVASDGVDAPNRRVEWRLSKDGKTVAAADFEVVTDASLSPAFHQDWARAQQFKGENYDRVRRFVELELLLAEGLHMAVLEHARQDIEAGEAILRTYLLAREALNSALGEDEAALTRSHGDLQTRILTTNAWSDAERDAAYDTDGR